MRQGYSRVGAGESFSSYSLTIEDVERIVAEHFGYDQDTVHISGLEMPDGEIHVSGSFRFPDADPLPEPR